MTKSKIVFATGNHDKFKEVSKIFSDTNYELLKVTDLGKMPEVIENGSTYEENAFIKADAIYNKFGFPVIADDSGIEVEQLDGRPGIYAARYAGEDCTYSDNNKKLINELKNFEEPHKAKFVCCALFYDGDNKISAIGELHGKIISEPKGDKGFGYDPVFVPDGYNITCAEMKLEEKNKISHRGKAFHRLKEMLHTKC
ncbi:MAG: RdgB/HAM1 family non-canonical purine NTP pyrophosphatase [Ignavibacteria bacterium]|jgi:XTP/dITP diphosphohydrolase